MQKIYNPFDWIEVANDASLEFFSEGGRTVRLEVNAPVSTSISYVETSGERIGEVVFLAAVTSRDTIEFYANNAFTLMFSDTAFVKTVDGEDMSVSKTDDQSFTRTFERRARNPELELMNALALQNRQAMDRLLADHRELLEAQRAEIEDLRAERNASEPVDSAARGSSSDAEEPAPDGGAAAPVNDNAGSVADAKPVKKV